MLHGAPKSGPIRALCELALRLDTISSCLAWTEKSPKSSASVSGSVSLLEFPRLGLTFASRSGVNNVGHQICNLYSMEHTGLFISNIAATCVLTQKLLKGIPHAIVLERQDDGALYILVPATAKPNVRWCHGDGNTFTSSQLELDRNDDTWINNLGDVKHYLYPVHLSRSFLFTPTLSSALSLLLFRFISNQYDEVFRLIEFCVSDTVLNEEERQLFLQLLDVATADPNTDAIACKLKIILVVNGTPMYELLEETSLWDIHVLFKQYLTRLGHVSALAV